MSRILAAWEQSRLLPMVALGLFLFVGIAVVEDSLPFAFAILALNLALGIEDHFRQNRKRRKALVETLRSHNALAVSADRRLREHAASEGLDTAGPMTTAWRQGGLPQKGRTIADETYSFHGVGCVISLPDEHSVDIDWEPDGGILVDLWHIQRWIDCSGAGRTSKESIAAAMQELARTGEVEAATAGKYRLRRSSP